jgi:hypothetical protein
MPPHALQADVLTLNGSCDLLMHLAASEIPKAFEKI